MMVPTSPQEVQEQVGKISAVLKLHNQASDVEGAFSCGTCLMSMSIAGNPLKDVPFGSPAWQKKYNQYRRMSLDEYYEHVARAIFESLSGTSD